MDFLPWKKEQLKTTTPLLIERLELWLKTPNINSASWKLVEQTAIARLGFRPAATNLPAADPKPGTDDLSNDAKAFDWFRYKNPQTEVGTDITWEEGTVDLKNGGW